MKRVVSLARALSKLGHCSRTQAVDLIRAGRVSINGRVCRSASFRCDPSADKISLDGHAVRAQKFIYLALHKPAGVVTTRSDELGRKTVYDLIGREKWVFPVGRLDGDSSGLLLLTNDNRLGEFLTNPLSKCPKTYRVRLDREFQKKDAAQLSSMVLDGVRLRPASVRTLDALTIEMTIVEGKNRQIRRMLSELNYSVVSLVRTRIGPLGLGTLRPGEFRPLRAQELDSLTSMGGESWR